MGWLWTVSATVLVFRDSYNKCLDAVVSRMSTTLVIFMLCLAYLAVLPCHPWRVAILVGPSVWITALIGRPEDEITDGITTTAVRGLRAVGLLIGVAGLAVMSAARLAGNGPGLALAPTNNRIRR